ncbi:glycoside hydrolase superfamily, partial [Chytriomyces sp. MP71]
MSEQQWTAPSSAILFQGFDWTLTTTVGSGQYYSSWTPDRFNTLVSAGVDYMWLPPPANSGVFDQSTNAGYLPRELDNLNSAWGTSDQLQTLVNALSSNGIGSVYDAVFNHRVGATDWCSFENPNWPSWYTTKDDEACDHTINPGTCSNPFSSPASNGCSAYNTDSGEIVPYARDMDFKNPDVITAYQKYQCNLRAADSHNVPYVGSRFDFVRGYSKQALQSFAATWTDTSTCDTIAPGSKNSAIQQQFCVVENWPSSIYKTCDVLTLQSFLNEIVGYISGVNCAAFDFITKLALTCAINNNQFELLSANGKPPGLIGTMPLQSVTFADNHDTGDSGIFGDGQRLMPFDLKKAGNNATYASMLLMANAYVLTHPGIPSIYYPHLMTFQTLGMNTLVQKLGHVRSQLGIKSNAGVRIVTASSASGNLYAAYINPDPSVSSAFTVAVKIGDADWCPSFTETPAKSGSDCAGTVVVSGPDFAVWSHPQGVISTTTSSIVASSSTPAKTSTATSAKSASTTTAISLPPPNGMQVKLASYSYVNGVLSGQLEVQNLDYQKVVTVYYEDGNGGWNQATNNIPASYNGKLPQFGNYELW